MKRALLMIALVPMAACGKSAPSSPPGPSGGSASATVTDAAAVADAAAAVAADAATPIDAAAAATTDAAGALVPDFGCIGISPGKDALACIVGQSGFNLAEDTKVSLVFAPLVANATLPPAIPILSADYGPGDDTIDAALAARVGDATRGFTPLADPAGEITLEVGAKPTVSPPVRAGELTVALVRGKAADPASLHTTITVARGKAIEKLDDSDKLLSAMSVGVRDLGSAVLLEERYSEAGEGVNGTVFRAWLCAKTAKTCAPIE